MDSRNHGLDFLKVIATIIIVFHHFQQSTGAFYVGAVNFYNGVFYWGHMVELFFCLSGFLMLRYMESIREGMTFKQFYLGRIIRLLPVVAVAGIIEELLLIVYNITVGELYRGRTPSLWGVLISILGLQEGGAFLNPCINNPTWYISVLLWCYCIFYFTVWISNKLGFSACILHLAMIFLGASIRTWNINFPFFNASTARGFCAFFTGLLLAKAIRKKVSIRLQLGCLVMLLVSILYYSCYRIYAENEIYWIFTFIFCPCLTILMNTNVMKTVFKHKIWEVWGRFSYDVYIWHGPLIVGMELYLALSAKTMQMGRISNMFLFCLFAEVLGFISWVVLEKPLYRILKDKYL